MQGLYDPDRVRQADAAGPDKRGGAAEPTDWKTAVAEIGGRLREGKGKVVLISDLQTGTLAEVMATSPQAFGQAVRRTSSRSTMSTVRAGQRNGCSARATIPDYRIDLCDYV